MNNSLIIEDNIVSKGKPPMPPSSKIQPVKIKVVGEDEWPEIEALNKKKGDPDRSHLRNGSTSNLIPVNPRYMASTDPNYGWGTMTSNEIEMATIIPGSSRIPSVMQPSTSQSSVARKRY